MKKWYMLFMIENPRTEWQQKIWSFEDLSDRQLRRKKREGWSLSGKREGEVIKWRKKPRRRGGADETNKNGILQQKGRI